MLLLPPSEMRKETLVAARAEDKLVVVIPADAPQMPGQRRVFYRVVPGDQLSDVALGFHVLARRSPKVERARPLGTSSREE